MLVQVTFAPGEGRLISLDSSGILCCTVTATLEQLFFTQLKSPVGPNLKHWSPQCSIRRANLLHNEHARRSHGVLPSIKDWDAQAATLQLRM